MKVRVTASHGLVTAKIAEIWEARRRACVCARARVTAVRVKGQPAIDGRACEAGAAAIMIHCIASNHN